MTAQADNTEWNSTKDLGWNSTRELDTPETSEPPTKKPEINENDYLLQDNAGGIGSGGETVSDVLEESLDVDYTVRSYYEHVYGNTDYSSLDVDPGTQEELHYYESLEAYFTRRLMENMILEAYGFGQHTDDSIITDDTQWNIIDWNLTLYGDHYEMAGGDISEYFTKYTFNNIFLGGKAWVEPIDSLAFMALAGRNRVPFDDTYEHWFGGGRVEFSPLSTILFGGTFVHTEVTDLYTSSTYGDYENQVYSFDTRMKFLDNSLIITGEQAYSVFYPDRRDPGEGNRFLTEEYRREGLASRLELDYRPIRELKLSFDYERVEPTFETIMGSASEDRQSFKGSVSYRPSSSWDLYTAYKVIHDKLNSDSPDTYRTFDHYWENEVSVRPFIDSGGYFQRLRLKLGYDYATAYSDDLPKSVNEDEHSFLIGISNSHYHMRYSVDYGLILDDDRTHDSADSLTSNLRATWGYFFETGDVSWDMWLAYRFTHERIYETNPDGSETQVTWGPSAGISVAYEPWGTDLSASYYGSFGTRYDNRGQTLFETRRNTTEVTLTQMIYEWNFFSSSMGLTYRNNDFWSRDPSERYGENVYLMEFSVHF
ncbi:MAG: hypothetical protein JW885_07200 [Deltaproteobacteria bacterium]|nr:hypothetical protein [Candidatus Zymogenaceae bacterium]